MLNHLKFVGPLLVCLSACLVSNAQRNNFSILTTVGLTAPILDNGFGFHLGVNPSYSLSSHFTLEGQVSYVHTSIKGTFLSGEKDVSNSANLLAGGRLYLNSEEKIPRLYVNALLGGNYDHTMRNGGSMNTGFSAGGFVAFNKFLVGISYDTPQNLIIKAGYIF